LAFTRYCFTSRLMCTNQPSLHPPTPTCIAHPGAQLMHEHWEVYDSPSISLVYAIHHTLLVITISCKGQPNTRLTRTLETSISLTSSGSTNSTGSALEHPHAHAHTRTHAHTSTHAGLGLESSEIYTYVYIYVCVCVYIYISLSLSIYIYIYSHTYIYKYK